MSIELAVAIGGLVLAITALVLVFLVRKRFIAAFQGESDQNLEKTLALHLREVGAVRKDLDELSHQHNRLTEAARLASQKISIVRFNPFGDTGGDQSFTLAVLDADNSGYVMTSIHGREGTRVYVKPIDSGKSKYTLSEEEKQALAQAAKRVLPNSKFGKE